MALDMRPQPVSRDTRRLLIAAALAVLCLWALARLRFPATPVATNPVPPLLAQLAPPTRFAELADEVGSLTTSLEPLLARVQLSGSTGQTWRVALRVRPGIAAAIVNTDRASALSVAAEAIAVDRPSHLMLVATAADTRVLPRPATQIDPAVPHYLFAASAAGSALAIRPVFVPGARAQWLRAWNANGWAVGAGTPLRSGEFLFTAGGDVVGVVAPDESGALAVVPASTLDAAIDGLLKASPGAGTGWLGMEVTTLTPELQRVTGAASGVLVTRVDAGGPGAAEVHPGEVVSAIAGAAIESVTAWAIVADRLRPGDHVTLRVGDEAGGREVTLTATSRPLEPPTSLGLHLQMTTAGAAVVGVDPGSAAAEALRPGDLITQVNGRRQPTPREIERAYRSAEKGLLVLFTRNGVPHAAAIER